MSVFLRLLPCVLVSVFLLPPPASSSGLDPKLAGEVKSAIDVALKYLWARQKEDGSWGGSLTVTALVVTAFAESPRHYVEDDGPFLRNARAYLAAAARDDGTFGDPPSVETTALVWRAMRSSTTAAYRTLAEQAEASLTGVLAGSATAAPADPRVLALQALSGATEGTGTWRPDLARRLLEGMRDDGSWRSGTAGSSEVDDLLATCFAVLALERLYGP